MLFSELREASAGEPKPGGFECEHCQSAPGRCRYYSLLCVAARGEPGGFECEHCTYIYIKWKINKYMKWYKVSIYLYIYTQLCSVSMSVNWARTGPWWYYDFIRYRHWDSTATFKKISKAQHSTNSPALVACTLCQWWDVSRHSYTPSHQLFMCPNMQGRSI